MRYVFTIATIFLTALRLSAQLDIRVGISSNLNTINFGSTSTYNFLYSKTSDFYYGGNNFSLGPMVDFEYGFKPHYWKKDTARTFRNMAITTHKSILVGMHLTNHLNAEKGVTAIGDDVFSSWSNRYLQIPVIYKINIQPFILDENFHLSFGLGITNSFLISSSLEESVIIYSRDTDGEVLLDTNGDKLVTQTISDIIDVAPITKRYLPLWTFEVSGSFKRLYIGVRGWFSLKDQYLPRLEENWQLDTTQSIYLGSYDNWGKVTYAGGAMVLAFKIN